MWEKINAKALELYKEMLYQLYIEKEYNKLIILNNWSKCFVNIKLNHIYIL